MQFLNDRMELSLGLAVLHDVAKQQSMQRFLGDIDILLASAGRLETDAFQMSFSGNPDELGQWRGYAANGMGCSVVTDTVSVRNVADVAGWVLYDSKEQIAFASHVLNELRHETDNNLIQQALIAAASFMKHDGFRPEMEFRLLKFPLHKIIAAGRGTSAESYARSLLMIRKTPVVLVVDAGTMDERRAREFERRLNGSLSEVGSPSQFKIIVVRPEIESFLFADREIITGMFGSIGDEDFIKGQFIPKTIIGNLLNGTNLNEAIRSATGKIQRLHVKELDELRSYVSNPIPV